MSRVTRYLLHSAAFLHSEVCDGRADGATHVGVDGDNGFMTRYWHGGAPGRKPGEFLVPPSLTGVASRREDSERVGLRNITQRLDLVYVTSDRNLARACAGLRNDPTGRVGGGTLYQVEPVGELLTDPDLPLPSPISFCASRAEITSIIDVHVARDDQRFGNYLERILSRLV